MVARRLANVRRFNDLILFRVREILLVSSPFDHFILQEDGSLTERIFREFDEFSLSAVPRFTHAPNGQEALETLQDRDRRFDLVLVMTSLADFDVIDFGRRVKGKFPELPVVLLSLDQRDPGDLRARLDPAVVDGVFVWTGDSKILLAIIKYVEDRQNVEHDVAVGNVRVILMIEDSPRYYSEFLRVLYTRLMALAQSLYSEGQTDLYRLMYMRSRPKLVHATSFEEGQRLFRKYRPNLYAVISDVRIPREGRLDPTAGLDFAREARAADPHLPILLQSAETEHRSEAETLEAAFADKNSSTLQGDLNAFLTERLGFGDFVFRERPNGPVVERARDLLELEQKLETVSRESLLYHAQQNHFSLWLMARSEFELSEELRPLTEKDFPDEEAIRTFMIAALREGRESTHSGIVADFHPDRVAHDHFSRIGTGNLGGKARGIAFLNKMLAEKEWSVSGLPVLLPKTVVLTTDAFDSFLKSHDLSEFGQQEEDDEKIARRFAARPLSAELEHALHVIVDQLEGPLAVRSSSMLEDSLHQPFAGIYSTLMIPNNDPDFRNRFEDLDQAVKRVFASTFSKNAKSYLKSTGRRVEEEKMAVIVQELVGRQRGSRYYPSFSGVAQSYNYYPMGPQKPREGVALVALGLGRYIVEGGLSLRFCPKHPQVLPQFANPARFADASQGDFLALDMETGKRLAGQDLDSTVQRFPLREAERDGALLPLASVYSAGDDQIRDDLSLPGPRVITFNNILKYRAIPLAEAVERVLEMVEKGLGGPAEVEFACEMGDWAKSGRGSGAGPLLYLLQLRPLQVADATSDLSVDGFRRGDLLCVSQSSLGHGVSSEIRDIVYVRRDSWESGHNRAVAGEIAVMNASLNDRDRRFLLIGPGRWGSADPHLGIPVQWSQISGARLMVEASPAGYQVDPSQGTHFFHNITSLGIGYLTVPPGADEGRGDEAFVDWEWLDAQPAAEETMHVRRLSLASPLTVVLDGRAGSAVVAKPGAARDGG